MTSVRLERLRTRCDTLGIDALLVTTPSNRRWVAGFTGSAGALVVTQSAARLVTDARYFEQTSTQSPAFTLVRGTRGAWWEQAAELLDGLGGKRLGFEPGGATYAEYQAWTQALAALPVSDRPLLVPAPNAVEALRAVKAPDELAALARAVAIADAAFMRAAEAAHPGMTERALAWEVQRAAMELGADGLSFPTIIASGPWGALPHAYPRDEVLADGQGVVMDLGVVVDGYCSDLTRTIVVGEPDAQFQRLYDIVLTAQLTAEERIEAGMTGREAHEIAARVIMEAGHGEAFTHGLGHGVGLDIHESPRLRPESADVLEDGHVVTVEPGVYLPGWGGIRIEDQCVMEGGRLRAVSAAPKLDVRFAGGARLP